MDDIKIFEIWGGVTKSFTVTSDVYEAFQKCSGDMNPLHTDETFAVRKGFPHCVMYGNILNGFVSMLIGMCLPIKNIMITAQDIKFKNPVFMNDILEARMLVAGVFESVNIVELKFAFKNEIGETVAKGHVQITMLKEK